MDELISKKAAIEAINIWLYCDKDERMPADVIKTLPPVQPKCGYWTESHEHIYTDNGVAEWTNFFCSECDAPNSEPTDFCPHCGADMRGEADGRF